MCFTNFGITSLALSLALLAVTGIPQVGRVTDFTWYNQGHTVMRLYSFFAMIMFSAAYHILPQITGQTICRNRIRAHFWLAMSGTLLMSLPLVVGGIVQGMKWLDPNVAFLDANKSALFAFRLTSTGELLFAVGAVLFLCNVTRVLFKTIRGCAAGFCCGGNGMKCAEVKP